MSVLNLNSIERKWLNSAECYKSAYEFFIEWRKHNSTTPTHLVIYEYLANKKFDWGNLRTETPEDQPYYRTNKINRLYEMDLSIIGIALSQLKKEGRIHYFINDMAKNAIARQLNEKIRKKVTISRYVNWENTFANLLLTLKQLTEIELPNKNDQSFHRYFNEKKENDS